MNNNTIGDISDLTLQQVFSLLQQNIVIKTSQSLAERKRIINNLIVLILKNKNMIEEAVKDTQPDYPSSVDLSEVYGLIDRLKYVSEHIALNVNAYTAKNKLSRVVLPKGNILITIDETIVLEYAVLFIAVSILVGNYILIELPNNNNYLTGLFKDLLNEVLPAHCGIALTYNSNVRLKLAQLKFDAVYILGSEMYAEVFKEDYNCSDMHNTFIHYKMPMNIIVVDKHDDYMSIIADVFNNKYVYLRSKIISPSVIFVPEKEVALIKSQIQLLVEAIKEEKNIDFKVSNIKDFLTFDKIYNNYREAINNGAVELNESIFNRNELFISPSVLLFEKNKKPLLYSDYSNPLIPIVPYSDIEHLRNLVKSDSYVDKSICVFSQNGTFIDNVVNGTGELHYVINPYYESVNEGKIYSTDKNYYKYLDYRIDTWIRSMINISYRTY